MLTQKTEAFYWGVLGVFVAVVCIFLTRLITHVDRDAVHEIGVTFAAQGATGTPSFALGNLEPHRFQIPIIAPTGYDELLFIITPATRAVTVYGTKPFELSCAYADDAQSAAALPTFVTLVRNEPLTPIVDHVQATPQTLTIGSGSNSGLPATRNVWSVVLPVPPGLRAKLQRTALAQAVIRCSFPQSIAASPTFSDRSMIVALPDARTGTVALEMSAFDGMTNLRFGGGIATPNGGDQVRILDSNDRLVRVEWGDEAALEQRDIILVLVGGLAAIGAAMFVESMRPAVKSRAKPGDAPES